MYIFIFFLRSWNCKGRWKNYNRLGAHRVHPRDPRIPRVGSLEHQHQARFVEGNDEHGLVRIVGSTGLLGAAPLHILKAHLQRSPVLQIKLQAPPARQASPHRPTHVRKVRHGRVALQHDPRRLRRCRHRRAARRVQRAAEARCRRRHGAQPAGAAAGAAQRLALRRNRRPRLLVRQEGAAAAALAAAVRKRRRVRRRKLRGVHRKRRGAGGRRQAFGQHRAARRRARPRERLQPARRVGAAAAGLPALRRGRLQRVRRHGPRGRGAGCGGVCPRLVRHPRAPRGLVLGVAAGVHGRLRGA
eukprot:Rhum_TRINITY_DN3504_c0_g1::Rhum_TRINITY_DN3504_c0_g1_i1::g.11057::m.11057